MDDTSTSVLLPRLYYELPPIVSSTAQPNSGRTVSTSTASSATTNAVNASSTTNTIKRKAGRPRDLVADSIAHEVKQGQFKCNFCDATWAHYNPYRVKKHGADCKGMPEEMRDRVAQDMNVKSKRTRTEKRPDQVESLIVECIVENALPLSVFTSSSMRRLMSPTVLPHSSALKGMVMDEIGCLKNKIEDVLRHELGLTVSFDVYSISGQTIVLVYVTTSQGRSYCVSGHILAGSDTVAGVVMAEMDRIGATRIVAVIASDPARLIIKTHYSHVLSLEPFDALFDCLADDVCRHVLVEDVVNRMRTVYARMAAVCDGLRSPDEGVYEAALAMQRVLPAIGDVDFATKLDMVVSILRPLHESSTRVNAASATLADVYVNWVATVSYYRELFARGSIDSGLCEHVVARTNARFSQQLSSTTSLTLAMFLHPTMALYDVLIKSPDQRARVVRELYSHMLGHHDTQSLYDDLAKFRHRVDIYARACDSPQAYWGAVNASAGCAVLPKIASQLFEVNGSNMAKARVKATLKWINAMWSSVNPDMLIGLLQCQSYYEHDTTDSEIHFVSTSRKLINSYAQTIFKYTFDLESYVMLDNFNRTGYAFDQQQQYNGYFETFSQPYTQSFRQTLDFQSYEYPVEDKQLNAE